MTSTALTFIFKTPPVFFFFFLVAYNSATGKRFLFPALISGQQHLIWNWLHCKGSEQIWKTRTWCLFCFCKQNTCFFQFPPIVTPHEWTYSFFSHSRIFLFAVHNSPNAHRPPWHGFHHHSCCTPWSIFCVCMCVCVCVCVCENAVGLPCLSTVPVLSASPIQSIS